MRKHLKPLGIALGALVLTTVGIGASDVLQNVSGGLAGLVITSDGPCAADSTLLMLGTHAVCVDKFEASPAPDCPATDIKNELDTQANLNQAGCIPESKAESLPWRFVSLTQAQQLCAQAGKRLPTNTEWYKAVSGLSDIDQCVIDSEDSTAALTGTAACIAPSGVHDLVGNVWEWVEGEVSDRQLSGQPLPPEGYVSLVDSDGIVLETAKVPQTEYGDDYAWIRDQGIYGIIRGGFFNSGSDAGLYAFNAAVTLDTKTAGIGFRCVQDIY